MPKAKLTDKEKKARKELLKNESKVVKFKRVCTPRLRKALKAIRQVGACSSNSYAYNDEQKQKILHTLIEAVTTVEKQFAGTHAAETGIEL